MDASQWASVVNRRKETLDAERKEGKFRDPLDWFVLRVPGTRLSLSCFQDRFERRRLPVIVTGLNLCPCEGEDVWQFLKRKVGSKLVAVFEPKTGETHSLGHTELACISEVIDQVTTTTRTSAKRYMYDVPLQQKLPILLESWRIPRYMQHDYLHRTMRGHPQKSSWPTLFIGAAGTNSPVHLDRWHGHFWMFQVAGVKRWTIWHPDDTCELLPSFEKGNYDPSFPAREEILDRGRSVTLELHPGELLFVPGGAVHGVTNLEPSVAVAGNFVDATNLASVLEDLSQTSLRYQDDRALFEALSEVDFDEEDALSDRLFAPEEAGVELAEIISGSVQQKHPLLAPTATASDQLMEKLLADCLHLLGNTLVALYYHQDSDNAVVVVRVPPSEEDKEELTSTTRGPLHVLVHGQPWNEGLSILETAVVLWGCEPSRVLRSF